MAQNSDEQGSQQGFSQLRSSRPSPDAMQSRSVSHEIEYALGARHLRKRLIPVLLRATRQIPWILRDLHMIRYEDPVKTGQHIAELLKAPIDEPQAKRRSN